MYDLVIVGGGIAGVTAVIELMNEDQKVLLIDRDVEEELGGLAKWSFGGMFFVNSKQQRRAGMKDNPDIALRDWHSVAEFGEEDVLPKKWAESLANVQAAFILFWWSKIENCFGGLKLKKP